MDVFYQHTYDKHSTKKGGCIILTNYDAARFGPERKFDVIMTSPPFCNRVDWDRIYAPEHFFLEAVGAWHTNNEFLGTTSIHNYSSFDSDLKFVTERSDYLRKFLKKVRERQIRNERKSDYYVKYFTQYFNGLFRVFDIAASKLREDNAGIYFVVQDNSHRGLRIQIGKALAESLYNLNFKALPIREWERHHLGLQNISRRYRLVNPKQIECIWQGVR